MQIIGFIHHLPTHVRHAFAHFVGHVKSTRNVVVKTGKGTYHSFIQSESWQKVGKPIYERNIAPLKRSDYLLMSSSVISSGALTLFVVSILGMAILPIAGGVSACLIFGSGKISHYRVRKHFDEIAWEHIDKIRIAANDTTYKDQKFAEINEHKGKLQNLEFAHLEKELRDLDEQLRIFRNAVLAPYYEEKQKIVIAHINILKELVKNNEHDKGLITALEQEINKIGTTQQNVEKVETNKQNLQNLQTAGTRDHLNELSQQIKELISAAQGPNLTDSKEAFINFLQKFQEKLAPYKQITKLIPRGPLDGIEQDKPADPPNQENIPPGENDAKNEQPQDDKKPIDPPDGINAKIEDKEENKLPENNAREENIPPGENDAKKNEQPDQVDEKPKNPPDAIEVKTEDKEEKKDDLIQVEELEEKNQIEILIEEKI